MNKVIFILGATGVGKSEVAINLAKKIDAEIISCDSVQVYKYFNIGTAKLNKKDMQGVVHHGIGMLEPEQSYTVYDYVNFAKQKIAEITSRGKNVIITGGTGLYAKALIYGYNFGGAEKNEEFRKEVFALIDKRGAKYVSDRLFDVDEEIAKGIDGTNIPRLVRGYEILRFGSKKETSKIDFLPLVFVLTLDRQKLYEKINVRTDCMFKNGFLAEARVLKAKGYEGTQPARSIGYKECFAFLNGEIDETKMTELIKQHSRNYAKRQNTFFKGFDTAIYVDIENRAQAEGQIEQKTREFLENDN